MNNEIKLNELRNKSAKKVSELAVIETDIVENLISKNFKKVSELEDKRLLIINELNDYSKEIDILSDTIKGINKDVHI